ncbi:MAG TPA: PTS sugar transporter subunit IIA [Verrucomicrobiae bacterium]
MYLNIVQLAESFGVPESDVEDWVCREGLPHTPDRGRLLFERNQVADWAAKRGLIAQAGFLAPHGRNSQSGFKLGDLLRSGGIWRNVAPGEVVTVFDRVITSLPMVTAPIRQLLGQRLRAKGGIVMAPVGGGFALPHLSHRIALGRESGTVALLLLSEALGPEETAPDNVPVTRLLFFLAPSPRLHLDLLARLSRGLASEPLRGRILAAAPDADILQAVDALEAGAGLEKNPEAR